MNSKTVFFKTFGCKQNQYDTDFLKQTFREKGFVTVDSGPADVVVVNTCAVTTRSAAKCRQAIRAAVRTGAKVLVTGCYPQVALQEIRNLPGVSVISGVHERNRLASMAEQALADMPGLQAEPVVTVRPHRKNEVFQETPVLSPTLTRAYLKVQEGCDDFCSYCIVPYARGSSRSRDPEKVFEEAASLVGKGYKELILTGTHLGLYGLDLSSPDASARGYPNLSQMVRMVCGIPGLLRLRVSSLEPHDVTREFMECLRLPQMCHHLHLPLQSGSNKVLRAMGRRYTAHKFLEIVDGVRKIAPDAGITTDIIAGFPGETQEDHLSTLRVASQARFSRIHVFKFSARPGTRAWNFPDKVPDKVKRARVGEIAGLGQELFRDFCSKHVGADVEVLVEDHRTPKGLLTGVTRNYIRCYLEGEDHLKETLQNVRAVALVPDGVFCELSTK